MAPNSAVRSPPALQSGGVLVTGVCTSSTIHSVQVSSPSLAVMETSYMPATSGVNVATIADGSSISAPDPAGALLIVQVVERGSPSMSLVPAPFRVATSPRSKLRSPPASQDGGVFGVVSMTTTWTCSEHSRLPSVTSTATVYSPGTVGVKDVTAAVGSDNDAATPAGPETTDHSMLMVSPLGS